MDRIDARYHQYFAEYREVKQDFKKEFISLWAGWLGKKKAHRLDEVTRAEWQRFNDLLMTVGQSYTVLRVDCAREQLVVVEHMASELSDYEESMDKPSSQFLRFVIPELECVIEEHWDYTYILWHKEQGVVEKLSPMIHEANLFHFA